MTLTPAEIDELARITLEEVGPVRGPLVAAIRLRAPHLSEDEVSTVVTRAFSLNRKYGEEEIRSQPLHRPVRAKIHTHQGRLSMEERADLEARTRELIAEEPDITGSEAHRRLKPPITLTHYRNTIYKPVLRRAQHELGADEAATEQPEPQPETDTMKATAIPLTPKAEPAPEPADNPPVDVMTSARGSYRAWEEEDGGDVLVVLTARVDRYTARKLGRAAFDLLWPEEELVTGGADE